MAEISYDESARQIRRLARRARAAGKEPDVAVAVRSWQALLAHPCAHHEVLASDVWNEIHQLHRHAGDYDAAIEAKRTAISVGDRSEPDPESDIAECHLLAGRRAEADALFAVLRERTPDDVWLYNAAGFSYAHAGDHREAQRWLRDGIGVAIRAADPDQVVGQLLDLLDGSLEALGEQPDKALHERVEAFTGSWQPVHKPTRWNDEPAATEERSCAHCGFDPDYSRLEAEERGRRQRRRILEQEAPEWLARLDALPAVAGVSERTRLRAAPDLWVAWFPDRQWAAAIERWPHLLDDLPADHRAYSHRIEARVKRTHEATPGHPVSIAMLSVDGLIAYGDEHGLDPGSAEARSAYAADIARTAGARRWPPGRNEACWCSSGRKYKQCCGPIPAAVDV